MSVERRIETLFQKNSFKEVELEKDQVERVRPESE